MKSEMPYHGVASTPFKAVCREVFANYVAKPESWSDDVLSIWREATFREERYAAIRLAAHKSAKKLQTPDVLPMYEEMIVTGAWWDYVDDLATHHVANLVITYPSDLKTAMRTWSKCSTKEPGWMWKRRTSILCQLPLHGEMDLKLLYGCIEPSIESKEFFLRKAIGWALRDLAWHRPQEVIRYVKEKDAVLSGLSKREALKNIHKVT